ncbi:MAG: hypothetical protein K5784_09780 [Clostridiales bacterium]|nr:hypothetical protein [Clostridiales bacterium]
MRGALNLDGNERAVAVRTVVKQGGKGLVKRHAVHFVTTEAAVFVGVFHQSIVLVYQTYRDGPGVGDRQIIFVNICRFGLGLGDAPVVGGVGGKAVSGIYVRILAITYNRLAVIVYAVRVGVRRPGDIVLLVVEFPFAVQAYLDGVIRGAVGMYGTIFTVVPDINQQVEIGIVVGGS